MQFQSKRRRREGTDQSPHDTKFDMIGIFENDQCENGKGEAHSSTESIAVSNTLHILQNSRGLCDIRKLN